MDLFQGPQQGFLLLIHQLLTWATDEILAKSAAAHLHGGHVPLQDAEVIFLARLVQNIHPFATSARLTTISVKFALEELPVKPGVQPTLASHRTRLPSTFIGTSVRPHEAP